jgi:hypothetical protein
MDSRTKATETTDNHRADAGKATATGTMSRRGFLADSGACAVGMLLLGSCSDGSPGAAWLDASGEDGGAGGDSVAGDGVAGDGGVAGDSDTGGDAGVPPGLAWLPLSTRSKTAFDDDDPDSRGLQFERVLVWYQGSKPERLGWVLGGQDENSVRISKDYGRTWTCPPLEGLYCSMMAGLYLDDDVFVAVGSAFATAGWAGAKPFSGCYIGPPDLHWAKRLDLTRASSTVGPYVSGSSGPKQAFVRMSNGSSNRRSQNCVARRPQTGGLTHAQRPIWVIEQQLADTGDAIAAIYVWKIVLSGIGAVASANMVRELPLATYASGDDGIYHVQVAPNGDVMLVGRTGVFLTTDGFATAPAKIYPASGNRECSTGYFYGGSASSASGARIGVYTADVNGGVWQSPDVRTAAFAKPTGAGGGANAGLPASYRVWHMGMSPSNPNLLAVCTDGVAPYRSTDGGKNFTKLPEPKRPGDEQYRYNIRGKSGGPHAGFHWCPSDEKVVLILTAQTMERSTDGLGTIDPKGCVFFDGMHDKGWGFGQSDWKQMLRVVQDSWVNTGLEGPDWSQANGIGSTGADAFKTVIETAGGGDMPYVSGACGLITPKNRVIAACNRNAGGQSNVIVILSGRDATTGEYSSYLISQSGVKTRGTHSRWSPKGGGVGFIGRWAVSNVDAASAADVVFTDHSGHEFIDCALDGSTLVSFWGDFAPGNDNGTAFYRSEHDLGGNQGAAWYTLPSSGYASRAVCVDHHHPTRERLLYVRNSNKDEIREVKKVNGGFVDTVLVNLRTMPGGVVDTLEATLGAGAYVPSSAIGGVVLYSGIFQLIADPHQPGLFYAIYGRHGMPNWWMTDDDGATWVNISGNLPRTIWFGTVHPYTGDVLAFSSMGGHCLPPPQDYPAIANRAEFSGRLEAFYGKATVPDPPVF